MTFWLVDTSKRLLLIAFVSIYILFPNVGFSQSDRLDSIPAKGMPTMIDLGATSCVPCKMMAPILEKLEKRYRGKAAIVFYDVWKDSQPARKFGIQLIPTQIFFDKYGNEVGRHEGFLSEEIIVSVLERLLAGTAKAEIKQQLPEGPMPIQTSELPEQSFWDNPLIKLYTICGLIIVIIAAWLIKGSVGKYHSQKSKK